MGINNDPSLGVSSELNISELLGFNLTGEYMQGRYSIVYEVNQSNATAVEVLYPGLPQLIWDYVIEKWEHSGMEIHYVPFAQEQGSLIYRVWRLIPFKEIDHNTI